MALQQIRFLFGEKSSNPHQKSHRSSGLEPQIYNFLVASVTFCRFTEVQR